MKPFNIEVSAKDLQLALADAVTGRNSDPQAYRCAALSVERGRLSITTTDSQTSVKSSIPLGAGKTCQIAVETDKLRRAITGVDEQLILDFDGKQFVVRFGRRRFVIPHIPFKEFPMPGAADKHEAVTIINGPELKTVISRVMYAAPVSDVRPMLNGIYFGEQQVVATDGNRMAFTPFDFGDAEFPEFIIPIHAIKTIVRFLTGEQMKMVLRYSNESATSLHAVEFMDDDRSIRVGLIAGRYVQWRNVIPRTDGYWEAELKADSLSDAISRVLPFSNKYGAIDFGSGEQMLTVTPATSPDTVDYAECDAAPKDVERYMHGALVNDVLQVAKGEEVTWYGTNLPKAQLFTIKGRDDQHVVMPAERQTA